MLESDNLFILWDRGILYNPYNSVTRLECRSPSNAGRLTIYRSMGDAKGAVHTYKNCYGTESTLISIRRLSIADPGYI